jgi:hypothetical protein
MAANMYGQTPIDPRAELLIGRAMRQEPIMGAAPLLGRLAALGVGLRGQRTFEDQIAASRMQFMQGLQSAGTDRAARLAVLTQGMASRDPDTRAQAMAQYARETEPGAQFVSGPGGATYRIDTLGGMQTGPAQEVIAGERKAPTTRTRAMGEMTITEQFNPDTGNWDVVGEAPRTASAVPLPPDVLAQQIDLRTAAGRAQGQATAEGLAAVSERAAAGARGRAQVEQEQAAEEEKRLVERATNASLGYRSAVKAWRQNPTDAANTARLGAERGRMVQELAARRSYPRAPTDADWAAADRAVPSPLGISATVGAVQGTDPFDAALRVVEEELGVERPEAPAAPGAAAAPPGMPAGLMNLSPQEMRRYADLIEKQGQQ